jgi:hypothetical protein
VSSQGGSTCAQSGNATGGEGGSAAGQGGNASAGNTAGTTQQDDQSTTDALSSLI